MRSQGNCVQYMLRAPSTLELLLGLELRANAKSVIPGSLMSCVTLGRLSNFCARISSSVKRFLSFVITDILDWILFAVGLSCAL